MEAFETRDEMVLKLIPPGSKVVEIGVFNGDSSEVLLKTKPERLYLIDPWDGVNISGDADGNNVKTINLEHSYYELMSRFIESKAVRLIRGRSPPALNEICMDGTSFVDAVYIDGDHSYQGVKKDLFAAYRLVRPGGWIMGHDYEMNPEKTSARYDFGVKKAVDEFCELKGLKIHALARDGCVSYAIKIPFEEEFKCPEWGC